MPRRKITAPEPSRQKFQKSIEPVDMYLYRYFPQWRQPEWFNATLWRSVVANQPLAIICRETLIANVLNLDWKIDARESDRRDELKDEIKYYTKFLEDTGDYDFQTWLEWILTDYLDIPFGGGLEIGREGDRPDGRAIWLEPLDGGTLFPTFNVDYPVGQAIPGYDLNPVYFPKHTIQRIYMSPRTVIQRKGWGMPPPEKVYLALELLNRGDRYYANLLLDTPEAGILDLGDMEKTSAENWVKSWREMLTGVDPFKVPVLYQHNSETKFITFTRSPTELMFDKATLKYAAILAGGYGMGLSDIGIQAVASGGETLAGSIRQERRSKKTGFGRAKKTVTSLVNRIINPELKFGFIDLDDEVSVALGRARLATATAFSLAVDKMALTPDEMRLQMIADGLISISIPEKAPKQDVLPKPTQNQQTNALGRPIAPSQGGWGEVKSAAFDLALSVPEFRSAVDELAEKWDGMEEDLQNEAIREIQSFLNEISVPENQLAENDIIEQE